MTSSRNKISRKKFKELLDRMNNSNFIQNGNFRTTISSGIYANLLAGSYLVIDESYDEIETSLCQTALTIVRVYGYYFGVRLVTEIYEESYKIEPKRLEFFEMKKKKEGFLYIKEFLSLDRKRFEMLLLNLNIRNIIQLETNWKISMLPEDLYDSLVSMGCVLVSKNLMIREYDQFETGILVFKIGEYYMGVSVIRHVFEKDMSVFDLKYKLEFFEMKKVRKESYE